MEKYSNITYQVFLRFFYRKSSYNTLVFLISDLLFVMMSE